MKRTFSAVAAVLLAAAACGPPAAEGPELVLSGGLIRLGDLREAVEAVAIDGDRIVAAGTLAQVRALAVESTQEMPLQDAVALPGLVDAWNDVEAVGRWSEALDLSRATSPREVRALLRAEAATSDGWTVGWGWDETFWPNPTLPDRNELDELGADPVLLYRRIGAVGWANTAALEAAGLAAGEDVEGLFAGTDGAPTGIVAGEALRRIESRLPVIDRSTRRTWIEAGLRAAAAAGFTTVATAPIDLAALAILRELEAAGDLPVRVAVRLDPDTGVPPPGADDDLLHVRGYGLTIDGPLRPPLAYLSAPYGDGSAPPPGVGAEAIAGACARARQAGLLLDVRAHGDAAVALALTSCPDLRQGPGLIVGADLPPADLQTRGLGLAPIPLQLTHDLYWIDEWLGAERAAGAHAHRDRLAAGSLAAFASAAPEFALDAGAWLAALSTRRDRTGYPLDGWRPDQRLSVGDALRVATRPLGGTPDEAADLVVWSADPLDPEVGPAELRPLLTIVAGRVVYSRPLVDVPFDIE